VMGPLLVGSRGGGSRWGPCGAWLGVFELEVRWTQRGGGRGGRGAAWRSGRASERASSWAAVARFYLIPSRRVGGTWRGHGELDISVGFSNSLLTAPEMVGSLMGPSGPDRPFSLIFFLQTKRCIYFSYDHRRIPCYGSSIDM
jgi:hypothetical protein